MRNPSGKLRAIAEAAIRAGDPRVQFVSPQLVIGGLQELEAEIEALREALDNLLEECTKTGGSVNDYIRALTKADEVLESMRDEGS